MVTVIVERSFETPIEIRDLEEKEAAFSWCLQENGVRFVQTYLSFDRRRTTCIYEAPDAESVRRVSDRAKMPYDRIWSATVHKP